MMDNYWAEESQQLYTHTEIKPDEQNLTSLL